MVQQQQKNIYQANFDIIGENSTSLTSELLLLKMANEFIVRNKLSQNLNSFSKYNQYKILINDTSNLFYLLVLNQIVLNQIVLNQIVLNQIVLNQMVLNQIIIVLQV